MVLGFKVSGLWSRVYCFRVWVYGFVIGGLGFMVKVYGFSG